MSTAADPGSAAAVRPLRADARRNRERILKAARAVFAEQGREAQIDDVARRAKVGVGTVYRHFPTKEALIEALAMDKFERMIASTEEALAAPDPWEGFAGLVWSSAERMAVDRALYEAISAHAGPTEDLRERLTALMAELLARGQAAGALRPDLKVDDIPMLMCGIGAAVQMSGGDAERWRRYVAMVLDGLRTSAATRP